jgi:hypothetical protein
VADVTRKRERRRGRVGGAHLQRGVDLLRDHVPGSRPLPGARDAGTPDRVDERPSGD